MTFQLQDLPPVEVPEGPEGRLPFCLPLRRVPCEQPRASVLLLHGASAASCTFLVPKGKSLVDYLHAAHCDVWLLDWRGGKHVAENSSYREPRYLDAFSMDCVATEDIPLALDRIRTEIGPGRRLHVLAHCFGAGCLAMAIAAGELVASRVERVVLLTLGLFYETPWDGFLKADDFVIERIRGSAPSVTAIHPGMGEPAAGSPAEPWTTPWCWPPEMQRAYEAWPKALLPCCEHAICKRVSFMFGHPYLDQNLDPEIHDAAQLAQQFGSMPLTLYIHAGQNVRRGFAAPLDASPLGRRQEHYLVHDGFDRLARVTLVTGSENEIWHRDSIHRMHDWLQRGPKRNADKHVIYGYGHQDLLWGRDAAKDVFPILTSALDL